MTIQANPLKAIPQEVLEELAAVLIKRFTPFAFTCDCDGEDPGCKKTINEDRYAIGQYHTVERIAAFITGKPSKW